jgi:hypothetical protein
MQTSLTERSFCPYRGRTLWAAGPGATEQPVLYEPDWQFGGSTTLGNRIVKIDPRPVSLVTVMSPPII